MKACVDTSTIIVRNINTSTFNNVYKHCVDNQHEIEDLKKTCKLIRSNNRDRAHPSTTK